MMPSISLVELAHNYGGVLWQIEGQPIVGSVSIDSRTITEGDCFVAIRGENYDAHEFLDDVLDRGASTLVVETPQQKNVTQWVVEDSVKALGQIALETRRQFERPVIAITGSNGKTTVKEMLAAVLGLSGDVLATKGNLNNHIGVPLTLFQLTPDHGYAVIEMGASAIGDIEYLCGIAEPNISLVNNVGEAHLEKFGSTENIFKAKGEIYSGLRQGGTAIVNLDSYGAGAYIRELGDCEHIGFSIENAEAEVRAENIQVTSEGSAFDLCIGDSSFSVNLNVPARHNISNALAAAACAYALKIPSEQIVLGLESFSGVGGRLQVLPGLNGSRLIDDSYNASPTSAKAAVDVLASYPGKRILVLGDMGELGESAAKLHGELGEYVRIAGIDSLVATGPLSESAVAAFNGSVVENSSEIGESGFWFETKKALVSHLKSQADSGVTLLIKGSRSSGMDRVVVQMQQEGAS